MSCFAFCWRFLSSNRAEQDSKDSECCSERSSSCNWEDDVEQSPPCKLDDGVKQSTSHRAEDYLQQPSYCSLKNGVTLPPLSLDNLDTVSTTTGGVSQNSSTWTNASPPTKTAVVLLSGRRCVALPSSGQFQARTQALAQRTVKRCVTNVRSSISPRLASPLKKRLSKLPSWADCVRKQTVLDHTDTDDSAENLDFVPYLVSGKVVNQPKDGSCLFHSIAFGLGDKTTSAVELRRSIAAYIASEASAYISNTSIQEWVLMTEGKGHQAYASIIASPNAWGGAIELAVAAKIRGVSIHVFERSQPKGWFRCIASFGRKAHPRARGVVNIVYDSHHFDALVVREVKTDTKSPDS